MLVLVIYAIFGDEKPEKSGEKSLLRPWRLSSLITRDEQKFIVESRLASSLGPVPLLQIYTSKTVWIFTLSWLFTTMNISLFTGRMLQISISICTLIDFQPNSTSFALCRVCHVHANVPLFQSLLDSGDRLDTLGDYYFSCN